MKNIFFVFALLISFLTGCCSHQHNHSTSYNKNKEDQALIQHLEDSTIMLLKVTNNEYKSICSGVWISPTKIISARHCFEAVLQTEETTQVDLNQLTGLVVAYKTHVDVDKHFKLGQKEKPYFAVTIAYDPSSDLALLDTIDHPEHDFVSISSENLFDGQRIHMVGHTNGMPYTYFPGVIANKERIMHVFGAEWKVSQISAPGWLGNSGGGVFDLDGRLIGIFSFVMTKVPNMGFCVHHDIILDFLHKENTI